MLLSFPLLVHPPCILHENLFLQLSFDYIIRINTLSVCFLLLLLLSLSSTIWFCFFSVFFCTTKIKFLLFVTIFCFFSFSHTLLCVNNKNAFETEYCVYQNNNGTYALKPKNKFLSIQICCAHFKIKTKRK